MVVCGDIDCRFGVAEDINYQWNDLEDKKKAR